MWSTIGETFFLQAGKNIKASDIHLSKDENCPYPCYGGNGSRGFVRDYNHSGKYPIVGRQGALCGNMNYYEGDFYATEHAVPVHVFANTNAYWAFLCLKQLNLNQYATATAQPGLSVNKILDVPIALPPQKEQYRIVEKVKQYERILNILDESAEELCSLISLCKAKVLELAICGKLCPQDPADESAEELLRRINPSAVTANKSHYKIPVSWTFCKINDICKVTMGQSPSGDSINADKGIEFHQGKIAFTDLFLSDSNVFTNAPTKIVNGNSILLCVRAPVGITNICKRKICIGRGLCAIQPSNELDFKYIYLHISTLKRHFESKATGTTFKSISANVVKNTIIPLPPVNEQKRIVAKVDELFAQIDAIQQSLE